MANIAAEEQAPWSTWDQLDDMATLIRYEAPNSSSLFVTANPGREHRERFVTCVTETRLP